jgi:heat shock protein HslJ
MEMNPMRLRLFLALIVTLPIFGVIGAFSPASARAQAGERCFSETGFCISGTIRGYWEQNGGLAVFGLPLGPEQSVVGEDGVARQTQWFERHRLEIHPENAAPYNVLLGRIGVDVLAQQGRDWQAFPPFDENQADAENCRFFQETRRQVCGEFLTAFRAFGLNFPNTPGITFEESLALFGLPISDPMVEVIEGREYTVQWFERTRFELHPENAPPFNVLFGRLGAELQSATPPAPAPTALTTSGPWELVSFGAANAPTPAAGNATLAFEGDRVSGSTGCNSFNGGFSATNGSVTFGPLASTLALCTEDALAAQELAIFTALDGARTYSVVGTRLTISYGDNQALVYRTAGTAGLERGTWQLTGYGPVEAQTSAVGASTLAFDGTRAAGSTGCNNFSGGYSATAGTISFEAFIVTAAACTDEATTNQERAILSALSGTVNYSIAGDQLRISYDGGRQALTYSIAGALTLETGRWVLNSFGDVAAPTSAAGNATIAFDGTRVSGSTGCNNFNGDYSTTADTITFGPLASTRAACTSDALTAQESAIFNALLGEVEYSISGNQLQIFYEAGRRALTYSNVLR